MVGFAASLPGAIKDAEHWPMDPAVFHENVAIRLWRLSGGGMFSFLEDSGIEPGGVGHHRMKAMAGAL